MNIFLKNKLYRLFTISSAFGNAGRTLFDIVFIIYATSLPNPELAVSIVSIATTLPYIIFVIRFGMHLWSAMVDLYRISICKCGCRYTRRL